MPSLIDQYIARFLAEYPDISLSELAEGIERFLKEVGEFRNHRSTPLTLINIKITGPRQALAELSAYLKGLRESRRPVPSHSQIARKMEWSPSKQLRIERGEISISVSDLGQLLDFYGIPAAEQQRWLNIAGRTYHSNRAL